MTDDALTLEEHAGRVAKFSWYAQEGAAATYLAAYEAERAARLTTTRLLGNRVDRCTALEAERDAALAATAEWRQRMVEAEVRAETQALEARVRELEDRIERARKCCNCPALDGAGEDDNG